MGHPRKQQRMFVEAVVSTAKHANVLSIHGHLQYIRRRRRSMPNNRAPSPAKMIQAHLGVSTEPCTCEATPGNTELSKREIIDRDKHPVAETTIFQKFACGVSITSVHPVKHI